MAPFSYYKSASPGSLSGLSNSRLVATDGSGNVASVDQLTSWIAGTANRVTITDDGDGTITLSGPQDLHTGASPTFAGLTCGTATFSGEVRGAGAGQTFRGLHLRTHPDADKAASQVLLVHADEITMQDGTRVADWDNLVADLTASGAGGLDTGSEAVSTWYESYAIRKSSDGTKGLMFHRAKDWYKDQSFDTGTTDISRVLRLASGTATDKLSQGITFSVSKPFVAFDVDLTRQGAVSGNVWFTLESDSGGRASGVVLATSNVINAATISTSVQRIRFRFYAPYSVIASTQYHLVMHGDYTRSDSVWIRWQAMAAGGYTGGTANEYNGSTWTTASGCGDFFFAAYVERNDTDIVLPAGYDQYAQLPPVFNNSAGNLNGQIVHDRSVTPLVAISSGLVAYTIPTLWDLSAGIPLGARKVRFSYAGAAQQWFGIAPVPDGYGAKPGTSTTRAFLCGGVGGIPVYNDSSIPQVTSGPVITEAQAVYIVQAGSTNFEFWLDSWEW